MECRGEIVAPAGVVGLTRSKAKIGFSELFGKIWEAMIATNRNDRLHVNLCVKCGDLEVEDEWVEIPRILREAVKEGGVVVNGKVKVCDRCANCISARSMVYGLKE